MRPRRASRLLEYFVLVEIICELALLSSTLAPFRVFFRIAAFGVSLALLFVLPGHGKQHPAGKAAFLAATGTRAGLRMMTPTGSEETPEAADTGPSP